MPFLVIKLSKVTVKKHIFSLLFTIIVFYPLNAQVDVLCVGNSITWGTGLADRSTYSYPSQLVNLLGDNYSVSNRGEPGSTLLRNTEHPYMESNQFYYSIVAPHDIVIITLGTNDTDENYWGDNENFKDDYYALIEAYIKANSDYGKEKPVFILGFPPPIFDESQGHRNDPLINEIIPMIKQIANAEDYTIADFYHELEGQPDMFSDGVHPNIQGAQIMAEVANEAIQEALTVSGPAPSVPTGLTTIPYLTSIDLEWHANLEDDIYQYRVFRADSENGYQNLIGNILAPDTTYIDNNVVQDHIYYYAIDAVDIQGNSSGRSNPVQGKTYDSIPPDAPSDLTAVLEADSIQLEWTANTENDLSRYYIYRNTEQTSLQESISIIATIYPPSSSYSDINYASAENYFYGIKAQDVSGNLSSLSNIVNITALSRPTSNDTTITAFEDQIHTFSVSDFPFNDADGHKLSQIIFIETDNWEYFQYEGDTTNSRFICENISDLSFASNSNDYGESYATFKFKVIDDFGNSSADTNLITIDVDPVNDEPTLNPIDDISLIEDSHDIAISISGISSGQIDEAQTLSVEVLPENPNLFTISDLQYISPDSSGIVILDPLESVFGTQPITIRIWDDGGDDNGGINYTDETFNIFIEPVNDPPVFNQPDLISIIEDTDTEVILNGIQAGPWENDQNISISVSSNNTDILPTPILTYFSPDTFAILSITTIPNIFGTTSISLFMSDDGGQDLGGVDSTVYIIPINIISVNDSPADFNIIAPNADSTLVINKHNFESTFSIDWESSEDVENDKIQYDIIFNEKLSELSQFGLESTKAEFILKDILAVTDTVSVITDTYSVVASDGELETTATNSGIKITIDGRSFAPAKLNLDQNFPNPFNGTTRIGFDLPKRSPVTLTIYNLLGKEIIKLIDNKTYERGYNVVSWNGFDSNSKSVPAGIYLMQITMQNETQHKKLILLK